MQVDAQVLRVRAYNILFISTPVFTVAAKEIDLSDSRRKLFSLFQGQFWSAVAADSAGGLWRVYGARDASPAHVREFCWRHSLPMYSIDSDKNIQLQCYSTSFQIAYAYKCWYEN